MILMHQAAALRAGEDLEVTASEYDRSRALPELPGKPTITRHSGGAPNPTGRIGCSQASGKRLIGFRHAGVYTEIPCQKQINGRGA